MKKHSVGSVSLVSAALVSAALVSAPSAAWAQCSMGITVKNNADSGPDSLRQAVADLCDGGTITFNSVYTISLQSALVLDKSMTINGPATLDGAHLPTPDLESAWPFVDAKSGTIHLDNLIIQNAHTNLGGILITSPVNSETPTSVLLTGCQVLNNTALSFGGGIANAAELTIRNSVIAGNSSPGQDANGGWGGGIYNWNFGSVTIESSTLANNTGVLGGGIYNDQGSVTITDSFFDGNTAAEGGGLRNGGPCTIERTVFQNNGADTGGGILNLNGLDIRNSDFLNNHAASGGGIYSRQPYLTLSNSRFSGNTATVNGGGAFLDGTDASILGSTFVGNTAFNGGGVAVSDSYNVAITNSTFSGNAADNLDGRGGGIYIGGKNKVVGITNCTLSGGSAQHGGGLNTVAGTVVKNTILANSTSGGDCEGSGLVLDGSNLVEDGSCGATLTGDPQLGSLESNGGLTQTMALLAGSPALAAGDKDVCAAAPVSGFDQRGVPRPTSHCAVGAYESNSEIEVTQDEASLNPPVDLGTTTFGNSRSTTFQVSNSGSSRLSLGDASITPTPPAVAFAYASGFGSTYLWPGESTTFTVTLDAKTPGNFSGQVSFRTNVPGQDPFVFTVTGTVVCGATQYQTEEEGSLTCKECRVCTGEEYRVTDCREGGDITKNRVCNPCNVCGSNEYQTTACQADGDVTVNRACTTCTPCGGNEYQTTACQAGGDVTVNRACTTCTACAIEEYQAMACQAGGDIAQNRVCLACSSCRDGEYEATTCRQGGDITRNRSCIPCKTCRGSEYELGPCASTADRVCMPCSGACPAGTTLLASCTAKADRICSQSPTSDAGQEDAGADVAVADALPDTRTPTPPDANLAPDTRSTSTPDTAALSLDTKAQSDSWVAPPMGGQDAQDDAVATPDALVSSVDSLALDTGLTTKDARVPDGAKDGLVADAQTDATADTASTLSPDARSPDAQAAAPSGGKNDNGCSCNLSGGSQPGAGLAIFVLGLALAARRRRSPRR